MHPTIVLISYIIYASALSLGSAYQLLAGCIVFFVTCMILRIFPDNKNIQMVWRLKWLFLSIMSIYAFATPGRYIVEDIPYVTIEGLVIGAQRSAILIMLVVSIQMLLSSMSQEKLLQGMYWLVWPLRLLGVDHIKIMTRAVLTLQQAIQLREKGIDEHIQTVAKGVRGRLKSLAAAVEHQFRTAIEEPIEETQIDILLLPAPRLLNWVFPVFLGLFFVAVEWSI